MKPCGANVYIPTASQQEPQEAYIAEISSAMVGNRFSHGLGGGVRDMGVRVEEKGNWLFYTGDMEDIYVETPPLALSYGGGIKHIYSTGSANALRVKKGVSFQMGSDNMYDWSTNRLISWPPMYTPEQRGDYLAWNTDPEHRLIWNRTYYGVMGAAVVPGPQGDILVAMTHGENKNGTFGPEHRLAYTTNTIEEWGRYDEPAPGTFPRPKMYEFDRVYYGLVGVAACPVSRRDGDDLMQGDMGPALWPSSGYLDAEGNQVCYGPRHPYAIVAGDYLYVYYIDDICPAMFPNPDDVEPGRMFGLKVARAPIRDIRPENFRLYFDGGFTEPALPAGFDKYDRRFVYEKGGRGDILLAHPSGSPVVRFTVAKLRGTDLYLGLSYDRQQNQWLWLSRDMVHFSRQQNLGRSRVMYPIFYNREFSSNAEIDPGDFYIGGTCALGGTEEDRQVFAARHMAISLHGLTL